MPSQTLMWILVLLAITYFLDISCLCQSWTIALPLIVLGALYSISRILRYILRLVVANQTLRYILGYLVKAFGNLVILLVQGLGKSLIYLCGLALETLRHSGIFNHVSVFKTACVSFLQSCLQVATQQAVAKLAHTGHYVSRVLIAPAFWPWSESMKACATACITTSVRIWGYVEAFASSRHPNNINGGIATGNPAARARQCSGRRRDGKRCGKKGLSTGRYYCVGHINQP